MPSSIHGLSAEFSIVADLRVDKSTHKYDRWGSALLFSLGAFGLLFALNQAATTVALTLTALSFAALVAGIALPPIHAAERLGDRPTIIVLAALLICELSLLLPLLDGRVPAQQLALLTVAVLAASSLSPARWLGAWQLPILILAHLTFALSWVLPGAPAAGALGAASAQLVSGANPYVGGAYHDLPLPVLLAAPAQWLLGKPTVALAVATTAAAALLAYSRPGRASAVAASALMLLPQSYLALDKAGTEPVVLLVLCATLYFACRMPRVFPFALGLLLATKVYLVLALPAILVLASMRLELKPVLGMAWKALLTFTLVVAPFVAWNPTAFATSVLASDAGALASSSTLLGWISQTGGPSLPHWVGMATALALAALVIGRAARTPSGFAAGIGLIFFGLFTFGAHATASQNALVLGALLASVAATGLPGTVEVRGRPPPLPGPIPW
ncbi:MAG: hypothetical protein ACYC8T_07675 [Myxococcaceae bacterium]